MTPPLTPALALPRWFCYADRISLGDGVDPVLSLHQISKSFQPGVPVLRDISLQVETGTVVCLLGPSGCGKTTLLRLVAGFEEPDAGEIYLIKRLVSRPGLVVPPEQRHVGMVFQDYALFPHLTVAANVGFGLHQLEPSERERRIAQTLGMIGMSRSGQRYPHELSGGQQQRVALARALAPQPELLLLDEPFSNLDVDLRERLGLEVRDILKQQGMTAILVLCAIVSPSPDLATLFMLALPILLLYEGCIWIIYYLDKRRAKQEAEEEAKFDRPYDDKNEPID